MCNREPKNGDIFVHEMQQDFRYMLVKEDFCNWQVVWMMNGKYVATPYPDADVRRYFNDGTWVFQQNINELSY